MEMWLRTHTRVSSGQQLVFFIAIYGNIRLRRGGKIEKEEIDNGLGVTQTSNWKSIGVREDTRISANMALLDQHAH